MVALKTSELPSTLRSAAGKYDIFLFHGMDTGEVSELASSTAKALSVASSPPGEILRLTDQDLAQTPGRLATEARMLSMFGGRPVIVVKQAPQLTPALLEDLLEGPELSAFIVIEGGNLKKDAKLRQLIEKARRAVAVACYGDDERGLVQLIRGEVSKAGLSITPDAVQLLTHLLGADRALSRAELSKLILYTGKDKQIGVAHVEAVVGDAAAQAFDAAVNAALAGDAREALSQIDRLAASGTPPSVFLGLLLAGLQRLSGLAAAIERGESADDRHCAPQTPPPFPAEGCGEGAMRTLAAGGDGHCAGSDPGHHPPQPAHASAGVGTGRGTCDSPLHPHATSWKNPRCLMRA